MDLIRSDGARLSGFQFARLVASRLAASPSVACAAAATAPPGTAGFGLLTSLVASPPAQPSSAEWRGQPRFRAGRACFHIVTSQRHALHSRPMKWLYLFIAIISEVIGTSALKSSQGFTRLMPSLLVVAGYAAAFYFLSLTLASIPVGVAYAIWSGVGILLVSLAGYLLYHQTLDLPAVLGITLIVAGVVILSLFSKSAAH